MYHYQKNKTNRRSKKLLFLLIISAFSVVGVVGYFLLPSATVEEIVEKKVRFDGSVTEEEKALIKKTIIDQEITLQNPIDVTIKTSDKLENINSVVQVFVPVAETYAVTQSVSTEDLANNNNINVLTTDEVVTTAIAATLGLEASRVNSISDSVNLFADAPIAFMPADHLDGLVKLIGLNDVYYLDSFESGALFREVQFQGDDAVKLAGLSFYDALQSDQIFKVNMTGVTALTRVMQRKLTEVGDPLYFSQNIGEFLADADLTHVSNEVSFATNCPYSSTLFCSPPEFIETLKASGVDLVEITGNHNNDLGSQNNTETIELYRSLGWGVVGGGLNNGDAARPYATDTKGSKVTFLAYNYPDTPNGIAISGVDTAGANAFDFNRIETEIATAKAAADFVIVNVQYWECYAYPDGYVEYPTCDVPIEGQESVFKQLVDLGADMVVGTSAHQPQTYEIYNGRPIYYGLGNMYFDQTSWPGTERGIVLTHYFNAGKLVQTKLTPTVYGAELQPRVMNPEEAEYLLTRLRDAR